MMIQQFSIFHINKEKGKGIHEMLFYKVKYDEF